MAAYNICGKTLHSTLQLPVHKRGEKDLVGTSLQKLQIRFHYMVIDEISMLGQKTFSWVDKRLRQATGALHEQLGGMSVLLFGDFAQLPPVGDRPLYSKSYMAGATFDGFSVYQMFSTVVILKQVLRQAGTDSHIKAFRELLMRIRDGTPTHGDWQALLQRTPMQANNSADFELLDSFMINRVWSNLTMKNSTTYINR